MPEKKDNNNPAIYIKARVSFLIDIECEDDESYNELIDDIKFYFKEIKSAHVNVVHGKMSAWKVSKQKKDDVIVKVIKLKN